MQVLSGIFKTFLLFLTGKVKFNRMMKNHTLAMPDGAQFTIFRRVEIQSSLSEPRAIFWIRFKPMNMGTQANIYFSLLPMMVFMGFKGFRSKYWGVDMETGLCQGLYEWQTVADAKAYSESIAVRFMTHRSVPGSVQWGIVDKNEEALEFQIN